MLAIGTGNETTRGGGIVMFGEQYNSDAKGSTVIVAGKTTPNQTAQLTLKADGQLILQPNIRESDSKYDLAGAAIVAKSFGKHGYIKYANGLLIQWGQINAGSAGSRFTITYHIMFNTEPAVFIVPDGGYNSFPQITYEGITTNGTTGFSKSGISINIVRWFAIGY